MCVLGWSQSSQDAHVPSALAAIRTPSIIDVDAGYDYGPVGHRPLATLEGFFGLVVSSMRSSPTAEEASSGIVAPQNDRKVEKS